MGENPIKVHLVNDIKMFGIYPEDNEDSLKSLRKGDQIGPLEKSAVG